MHPNENEAPWQAGVAPGGLYTKEQIGVLLCWLAESLPQALSVAVAEQVFAEEALANYFEYQAAVQRLLEQGTLKRVTLGGKPHWQLSEHSRHAVHTLATELPRGARDRALHRAEQLQLHSQNDRGNAVSIYPAKAGGYYITLRQTNEEAFLMSLTLYAPDRQQMERMRERFLQDPSACFGLVLSYFAGSQGKA